MSPEDLMNLLLSTHYYSDLELIGKAIKKANHTFLPGNRTCEKCNINCGNLIKRHPNSDSLSDSFEVIDLTCDEWIIKGIIE